MLFNHKQDIDTVARDIINSFPEFSYEHTESDLLGKYIVVLNGNNRIIAQIVFNNGTTFCELVHRGFEPTSSMIRTDDDTLYDYMNKNTDYAMVNFDSVETKED